jgi:putative SOS response-associated peptidase YedK
VCGRFVQTSSAALLAQQFGAHDTTAGGLQPRHNVAPSTPIPAIVDAPDAEERRLGLLRWGFVPAWSRDPASGPRPINARVEGAATSRLFAPSLERRRCIVPVDAWYEWTEEAGARQPWLLRPRSDRAVAVAALWSPRPRAQGAGSPQSAPEPEGQDLLASVALMTTEALGAAASVHHRMPLCVPDELLDAWLDPGRPADATLLATLAQAEPDVAVVRVSRRVNDVRNDGPELLDAVEGP